MNWTHWLTAAAALPLLMLAVLVALGYWAERRAVRDKERDLFRCSCCGHEIMPPFFPDEVVICKTCNPAKWEQDRRRYNDKMREEARYEK